MKHALSIDVEDYFQVLNMSKIIDRSEWDTIQLRCGDSTKRVLEVLDRREAKATFFFLGWIAERLPELVQEVQSAGHEIGSHGYDHRVLHDLGEEAFKAELQQTNNILRDITGNNPTMFRACTWSVTKRTPWALDALVEAGFAIDSSIYPVQHPDYGVRGAPHYPYRIQTDSGHILEFPPLTMDAFGYRLPVGGGGYMRLFPSWLLRKGLRQHEKAGWPGCIYLHPWELDPDQPRQNLGGLRRFRHYVNLSRTAAKLDGLCRSHCFVGLQEALTQKESMLSTVTATSAKELCG